MISPKSRRVSNFSSFHLIRDDMLHPVGFNGYETIDRQRITSSPSRTRGAGDTRSVSQNSGGGYPVIGYRRRGRRFRGCPTWRTFCPSRDRNGNAGGFQRDDSKICNIKITGNTNIECANMSNYGTIAAYAKDSIIDRCVNERDILIGN